VVARGWGAATAKDLPAGVQKVVKKVGFYTTKYMSLVARGCFAAIVARWNQGVITNAVG
jgi:hypothetical protein